MPERKLSEIAAEVLADWHEEGKRSEKKGQPIPRRYYAAVPYANAMLQLSTLDERYGLDRADSVVVYFLSNAQVWTGDTARRIKAELRVMLDKHAGHTPRSHSSHSPRVGAVAAEAIRKAKEAQQ